MCSLLVLSAGVATALFEGQIPDPVEPMAVLVDRSEPAYVVFYVVPKSITEEELGAVRTAVADRKSAAWLPWLQFLDEKDEIFSSAIKKDEYSGARAREGVVELLRRYPGVPVGITWNGGLAITASDYRYTEDTYRTYLENPNVRARPEDARADPVHPRPHLASLLGWK